MKEDWCEPRFQYRSSKKPRDNSTHLPCPRSTAKDKLSTANLRAMFSKSGQDRDYSGIASTTTTVMSSMDHGPSKGLCYYSRSR